MRTYLILALAAGPALAQQPASAPAAFQAAPIPYKAVAEALAALEARDGRDTVVTHADGWTTVNEPSASAQWSFPPRGHYAYPSVIRRTVVREPGGQVTVDTSKLCETEEAACTRLAAEFEAMNERIIQAVKARRRGPGTPPGP